MRHYFIYKTIHKESGKFYIGAHETDCIDDKYLGSGTIISRAVKKYGYDAFSREVIETFVDRDAMYLKEKELVNEMILQDLLCMNIALGGTGGSILNNRKPFSGTHSKEARHKISLARQGRKPITIETRNRLSQNNFSKRDPERQRLHAIEAGKKSRRDWREHSEETRKKISQAITGKIHSEETKEKMRGFIWVTDGSSNKKHKKDSPIEEGWRRGRSPSK